MGNDLPHRKFRVSPENDRSPCGAHDGTLIIARSLRTLALGYPEPGTVFNNEVLKAAAQEKYDYTAKLDVDACCLHKSEA